LDLANLVLQDTLERIIVNDCYGEKERGIFIIRGENVVLLGEVVSFKFKWYFLINVLFLLILIYNLI